jgi:alkylation response protein AidB-like acyl-CoA dehydrogenase
MNFELTPAQQAVQAMVRHFALTEVAPLAREMDEQGSFRPDLIRRMGALGLLGGPLPVEYGGQGFDYTSLALIYEEIGRACSSVRGFLTVHVSLVSLCIRDWGTDAQRQAFLPRLARGELLGCYALTEPNAGSDVGSLESTAVEDGGGFVLNGKKIWITNGSVADLGLVFASVDRAKRHKGVTCFLVPTDTPGFKREPMPGKELGHRGADHAVISLEDCRVPQEAVLGEVGGGFRVAMGALDHGRLGVAAGAVGILQACVDACVDFARQRRQFGQRVGDFQMIQERIANMVADLEAARWLTYRAAWQKDQGLRNTRETSIAKLFATEAAARHASEAVLLHGGYGYSNLFPVERYYRDIKGLQIYEGTSHIQRIIIARDVIGREDRETGNRKLETGS